MPRQTCALGLLTLMLAVVGLVGGWQAHARPTDGDQYRPAGCCESKASGDCCPTDCCPPDCCPHGCCEQVRTKVVATGPKVSDDCCPTDCCTGATAPKTPQARSSGCCAK
jgi:hypothetical protein